MIIDIYLFYEISYMRTYITKLIIEYLSFYCLYIVRNIILSHFSAHFSLYYLIIVNIRFMRYYMKNAVI